MKNGKDFWFQPFEESSFQHTNGHEEREVSDLLDAVVERWNFVSTGTKTWARLLKPPTHCGGLNHEKALRHHSLSLATHCFDCSFKSPCTSSSLRGWAGLITAPWSHLARQSEQTDDLSLANCYFAFLRPCRKNHSERSACMTSTRAARAAGSIEATTAAPNSTNAETITGHAPGIFKPPK